MDFCRRITAHPELLSIVVFMDEASYTWDSMNNNMKFMCVVSWKSHEMTVIFQRRFSVNVWCGLLANKLIGLFVSGNSLIGDMCEFLLRNELTMFVGRHTINNNESEVLLA